MSEVFIMGNAANDFGVTELAIKASIASEFETDEINDFQVLAAYSNYNDGGYEHDCWFLLKKEGFLYVASGSHCSCHGYEDQFSPQIVNVGYLATMYSGSPTQEREWQALLSSLS